MKSVSLALAVLATSFLASAQNTWPEVNIPLSFKANGAVNTWDGKKLTSLQGASGSFLVDSVRNKA